MADPTGLEHLTPVVIDSTSATERAGFRKCRRQWFLTTVHRLDPNTGNVHFFLGNIYHAALAAYYASQWADDPVEERERKALDTYEEEYRSQVAKVEKQTGFLWGFTKDVFEDAADLGLEMLYNYMERERLDPLFDEVIAVEFRVNVPIEGANFLSVQADVVGRKDGELAVADHKTASRVMPSSHLDLDDQLTAEVYSWWKSSGEFPEKAIYNVSYKKSPKPPKLIRKGTALSKAKNQSTTAALYRQAINEHGFNIGDYLDIIATLEDQDTSGENALFRREAVFRTPGQMAAFEVDLAQEWRDMKEVAAHPERAYPNPTSMNCSGCPVRIVCTTIQDGGDVEAVIKAGFIIADPRR